MSKFVVGIDPSPTCAFLGFFHQGKAVRGVPVPLGSPEADERNVRGASRRAHASAEAVVARVLQEGKPDMVVMSKLLLQDITKDPSGARRAALWWEIVRQFDEMGVPIAEMPPMAAQSFMGMKQDKDKAFTGNVGGKTHLGGYGFKLTKTRVMDTWRKPDGAPLKDNPEFRYSTIAMAAAGGMVMGWDVGLEPSDARLRVLTSKACDFPDEFPLSLSESTWKRNREMEEV